MKPFMGIDTTQNADNDIENSCEWIAAEAPSELAERLNALTPDLEEETEEEKPKRRITLGSVTTGVAAVFVGLLIICRSCIRELGFAGAFADTPWLFYACGVAGLLTIPLVILRVLRGRAEKKQVEARASEEKAREDSDDAAYAAVCEEIYEAMGVPSYADRVDIMMCSYRVGKDGAPQASSLGIPGWKYLNIEMRVYRRDGVLYLADAEHLYAIPASALLSIRTVEERVKIPGGWHKEVLPTDPKYAAFGLRVKGVFSVLHCPSYCILEVAGPSDGETTGIYFPNYELPVMKEITGMEVN